MPFQDLILVVNPLQSDAGYAQYACTAQEKQLIGICMVSATCAIPNLKG